MVDTYRQLHWSHFRNALRNISSTDLFRRDVIDTKFV